MSLKTKRTTRRASRRPPASGRKPTYRFSARDVMMTADELQTFHREFQPLLQRREQQRWSLLYLCGQLSNLERKTIEPMVLALIGRSQCHSRDATVHWTRGMGEPALDDPCTRLGEPMVG